MTTHELEMAVGIQAASKLAILKSRIREMGILPYESLSGPPIRVTVTSVNLNWDDDLDYLTFSCGHASTIGHDDENSSLVGAETDCERTHS